jgi:hypothetical protein
MSSFGGSEPTWGRSEANGGIEGSHFALDVFRRGIGGNFIENKTRAPFTDKRASNRELVCL